MAFVSMPYLSSSDYSLYSEQDFSMDPESKHSHSPSSAGGSYGVSRYLMDSSALWPASPFKDDFFLAGIPPALHSPPFQREETPSYTNASTCSGALSPRAEPDNYHPVTPPTPDMSLLSQLASRPPICSLMELSDTCVGLGDVNPIQDNPSACFDNNMLNIFDPYYRTCSMSSDGSNISSKSWSDEAAQQQTCLSPAPFTIKEESQPANGLEDLYASTEDDIEPTHITSPYLKGTLEENGNDKTSEYERSKSRLSTSPRSTKRRSTSEAFVIAKRPRTSIEKSLAVSPSIRPPMQGTKGQHFCRDCPKSFKDQNGLESHIKKQHTRPFTCIFEFAGCRSTFPSKNEWKRHCASQHIVLQYWVCQQDACAQVSNKPDLPTKQSSAARKHSHCSGHADESLSSLPNGTIFNRKDLYTQHLRRMHVPTHLKNKVKSKTPVPEWEEQQRAHQNEALRIRCHLPEHMTCPAPNCNAQFEGSNAWDDRMEHVAKHLEKAATHVEPPVPFGSESDESLIEWASSPAIGILRMGDKGRWVLQNPLKANTYIALSEAESSEDADAEGEEIDE